MTDYVRLDETRTDAIRVTGGADNAVWVQPGFEAHHMDVAFHGVGNALYLDQGCQLSGQIHFHGSNGSARFARSDRLNVSATIYDDSTLEWGPDCTAYGVRVWVHGGRKMTVGAGCLFSENIQIRTSDHHSIIDLETGLLLNEAADVAIGDRVWISEGARIGKGVTIGAGSIIAGSAFVVSDVPAAELWGGVPAKRLKASVSWTNEYPASAETIESAMSEMRMLERV
jgi:acetyltransferase-like isoleucine patch superfamily enzyme